MQTKTTSRKTTARTTRSRAGSRAGAVLSGALAAVAVWAVLDVVLAGVKQPGFGAATPHPLSAGVVAVAGLLGGFLGWAVLVVTERLLRRGRKTWLAITLTGLAFSFGGPLTGDGIEYSDRAALALLHLTVAAVVIPLLYRTALPGRQAQPEDR